MKPSLAIRSLFASVLVSNIQAGVTIIDDTAATLAGSWSPQAIGGRYSGGWHYQNAAAGADTATYTFSGVANGKYVASRSSFVQANLSEAAVWTISDGGGNFTVDQRVATNHFDIDSAPDLNQTFARFSSGNAITPFSVTDGTLTMTLSDTDGAKFLVADAARLESVRSDVDKIYIIGNGDAGYSETTGSWASWSGDTNDHGADLRFGSAVGDALSISFTGIDPGQYRISAAWTGGGNRPTSATLAYSTAGGSGNMTYSQIPGAAANDVFENVNWQDMFSNVTVTGTSLTLTLTNNSGNALIGDGFRLEKLAIPEPTTTAFAALAALGLLRRRRL
jgi:hypothetical protein